MIFHVWIWQEGQGQFFREDPYAFLLAHYFALGFTGGEIVALAEAIFELDEIARHVLLIDRTVGSSDGAFDVAKRLLTDLKAGTRALAAPQGPSKKRLDDEFHGFGTIFIEDLSPDSGWQLKGVKQSQDGIARAGEGPRRTV